MDTQQRESHSANSFDRKYRSESRQSGSFVSLVDGIISKTYFSLGDFVEKIRF